MAFDPRSLKYKQDGIPILSALQIEDIAIELLEKHCPEVLKRPMMTPVAAILQKLNETTSLGLQILDLGYKGTAKILGRVRFKAKLLLLDVSLENERRAAFRFTAAHEIGHWVLHRWNYQNWTFRGEAGELTTPIELEDDDASLCRLEQRTPDDWLEWQANVFASSLVLPRACFQEAVIKCQTEAGIIKNLGVVYHTPGSSSSPDYLKVLASLAHLYGVSKTSVEVRLKTLNLFRSSVQRRPSSWADAFEKLDD